MPPSNPDHELKRRARRRLVGAITLMLAAVVILPLLLEDEPPPGSTLAIKMQKIDPPRIEDAAPPSTRAAPDTASEIPAPPPLLSGPSEPAADAQAVPDTPQADTLASDTPPSGIDRSARVPSAPGNPAADPSATRPPSARAVETRAAAASPVATVGTGSSFIVQLAALTDSARADSLKARAALTGLRVYTDRAGALTRVRVGPFATREAAVEAALRLAENGLHGQVQTR